MLRCSLFNPYQIQIYLTRIRKYYYFLFTWLVIPLPVHQPETTKCWPVSPAFARLALQATKQRNFFLPSLQEKHETYSHEAKQILQHPQKIGFKLLKWSSNAAISEKLGKKAETVRSHFTSSRFYFLQIFLPRKLSMKTTTRYGPKLVFTRMVTGAMVIGDLAKVL